MKLKNQKKPKRPLVIRKGKAPDPTRSVVIKHLPRIPSLDLAIEHWIATFPSVNTRQTYQFRIRKIRQTWGDLLALDSFLIDQSIERRLSQAKPNTVRLEAACLRSFYRFLERKIRGFRSPFHGVVVRLPKEDQTPRLIQKKSLPEQVQRQVLKRLAFLEKEEGREPLSVYLFRFLLNTGLRVSEAISLEFFDPAKDEAEKRGEYVNFVRREGRGSRIVVVGKGGRVREQILNPVFTSYLFRTDHCPTPGRRLFLNRYCQPITRHGVGKLLKALEKETFPDLNLTRFSPHSLRHSFISSMVEREVALIDIAQTCGNSIAIIEAWYKPQVREIGKGWVAL